jgi:transcriptional antiterminator NusG
MSTSTKISGFQWYAVQTLSNLEAKVKRYLDKFIDIEEMGDYIDEVLMPTEVVTEVRNGKKTQKTRKLYPGYLYLHMRLYDENGQLLQQPWYFVRGVDGVIGFIGGAEDRPTPLKEKDVQTILDQVKNAEGTEKPKIQYEAGDEVKITDGPFLNLTGRIDEIDPERGKLKVSVSIFGRFTPVELEYWQVQYAAES